MRYSRVYLSSTFYALLASQVPVHTIKYAFILLHSIDLEEANNIIILIIKEKSSFVCLSLAMIDTFTYIFIWRICARIFPPHPPGMGTELLYVYIFYSFSHGQYYMRFAAVLAAVGTFSNNNNNIICVSAELRTKLLWLCLIFPLFGR